MRRILAILAIILISNVGYGQERVGDIFNTFRGENNVTSVSVGELTMKLASLFTETMGVDAIEVLEFDDCSGDVKDRLAKAISNIKDPDYETMVTTNEDDSRTKILVKIKNEMLRELVVCTSGSDNALIRIKGKIKPEDIEKVVNEHK